MARQLGAIRFTGKLANVVGYKNSASSKTNNNFARERVYEISNPKTEAQARQRAKARPAQIFYAAFEPVLNHAFLPTGRASRNRNKFMSYAMSLPSVPDVRKGEAFIPALDYRISQGSLGLDSLVQAIDGGNSNLSEAQAMETVFFPNLKYDHSEGAITDETTVATLSEYLLDENPELVEGMELTFLAVLCSANDIKQRIATHFSMVLDKGNTLTTLGDIKSGLIELNGYETDIVYMSSADQGWRLLSAGLIISSRTGNSYVYTNSSMGCSLLALEQLASEERYVIASYMTDASNTESDLILQQATNAISGNVVGWIRVEDDTIVLAEGYSGTTSAEKAAVAINSIGGRAVVVSDQGGQLMELDGDELIPITFTSSAQGATAQPLTIDMTTFDGNSVVRASELSSLGFSIGQPLAPGITSVVYGENLPWPAAGTTVDILQTQPVVIHGIGLNADNLKLANGAYVRTLTFEGDTVARGELDMVDPPDVANYKITFDGVQYGGIVRSEGQE